MLIITPLRIGKLLLFCFPCKRRYKNVRTYSCIAKPLVTDPKVNYGLTKKYRPTKFISTTGQSAQRLCFCIGHVNHCSINKISVDMYDLHDFNTGSELYTRCHDNTHWIHCCYDYSVYCIHGACKNHRKTAVSAQHLSNAYNINILYETFSNKTSARTIDYSKTFNSLHYGVT